MPEQNIKIPKRILSALLSSMAAGVVPRVGAPYIAIGRSAEVTSLCRDLETISDGGSATRFIIGKYGSGKSFLIQLMRGYAVEHGYVTADADLSPERRLCSSGGGGIATYRELIKNLAVKSSPDGGALPQLLSKWLSDESLKAEESGIPSGSPEFEKALARSVYKTVRSIETGVGAFDFSKVVTEYFSAVRALDDERQALCLKWLRGEFGTKTEAKAALGVTGIINDDNWYDYVKILAAFSRRIGYGGLVVFIDECVNLYKIPNRVSRENNYEKILSIFNDTLQGKAEGLCVVFAGTPQFLEDRRRGLFGYEALRSRLNDTMFGDGGETQPLFGPIIRLKRLSDDELLALMARVTNLFRQGYGDVDVTPEEMRDFLYFMLSRAGADSMITPREIIRSYLTALGIMLSDKSKRLPDIYASVMPKEERVFVPDPDAIEF